LAVLKNRKEQKKVKKKGKELSVWGEYSTTSRYLTGMCSERGYVAISRIVMAKINFLC
jgi:hypothetical protein